MSDEIFELVLKEESIKLKDGKGLIKNCVIRQFDGAGRDAYNAQIAERVLKNNGDQAEEGKILYHTRGLAAFLLSQTLFEIIDDGAGRKAFPLEDIQAFPPETIDALGMKARVVCGLDPAAEERAKNS